MVPKFRQPPLRKQTSLTVSCFFIFYSAPVFFCLYPGYSQSIAHNLGDYRLKSERDVTEAASTSFSGVSFHFPSDNLFVIDDAGVIWEMDVAGNIIRELQLSGFDDTEGIAHLEGNTFLIVEERIANIQRIEIPSSGPATINLISGAFLTLGPNMGNSGLEGVTYLQDVNKAYVVKELGPPLLYEVSLDENGNPESFVENTPFSIGNISGDAADILALPDGYFLLLSQEENTLYGYSPQGEILSQMNLGLTKPEGVSWNPETRDIYIVGEPHEYALFENAGSSPVKFRQQYKYGKNIFRLNLSSDGSVILPSRLKNKDQLHLGIYLANGRQLENFPLRKWVPAKSETRWESQSTWNVYFGVLH